MPDIKWIKLATSMPDDEKIKLIDVMPERDTIHYVWIRLLIQAGKTNADGEIFLSEDMPCTDKMLAILFSRPLASIKLALKTLSRFGMIEIFSDKVIKIVNWEKYQNIEGMEKVRAQNRKRAESHREKKKQEKNAAKSNKGIHEDMTLDEIGELDTIETNENVALEEEDILNKNEASENLEISEEMSIDFTDDNNIDVIANADNKNDIKETSDDKCNSKKKYCNVTQNKSNVTVTVQNKKEIENKNKKKKKEKKDIDIESDKTAIAEDIKTNESADNQEIKESGLSQSKNIKETSIPEGETDINLKAIELISYYEKITGILGGLNYIAVNLAIDMHGYENVKMAIDRAFEKNHTEIEYINGILKNWRREGYPKEDMEVKKNRVKSIGKSDTADKNEFAGFKPKAPRRLTEAERKRIEANLI